MTLKHFAPIAVLCLTTLACDKAESTPSEASPNEASAAADTQDKAKEAAKPQAADPHAGLSQYDIEKVDSLLAKGELLPVDANSEDTRKELGTLPGAVLLTSSREFAMSELPEDKAKDLVFYCGSERCTSAPKAAKRAKEAGYLNVHVMPAGIKGWVEAGKKVDAQS